MRPAAFPAALAVLALAACGSQRRVTPPPAEIQRATAVSIAHRSDMLAAALRRGDACAAKIQAHGLERQTTLAIAARRIPARYRPRLLTAIRRLVAKLPICQPPAPPVSPPPPAPPPKHDHHPPPKPKPPKHDHDHGGDHRGHHG
jgi:hypothetical protein